MSIPILETCRKRKRRPRLFAFHTFADPGCPVVPTGVFQDNIRVFLKECAEPEEYCVRGMPVWCTLLVHQNKSFVVPLYTIEENVFNSSQPYCDHCKSTGWSYHFVSKRKYHLIVPNDREWNRPLDDGVFDLQTHLLHGLIHGNGFGHLICINGIEGGSKYLCGRELMDLWNRICENLQVRKITVEDLSKKHGMDLRLLHGVAYGHPWFGRWGYRFGSGSFGITQSHYDRATEVLSSLELEKIIHDFTDKEQCMQIRQIVRYYRDISEVQLITIRDLLRFMLTIKSCAPLQQKLALATSASAPEHHTGIVKKGALNEKSSSRCRRFSTMIANMDSRWPARRLEFTAEVIVNALKERREQSGYGGMTRQDLRDAARMHIGDTGLLDYVLKSMNNVIVGFHVVRRAVNSSRVLEYTIDDICAGVKVTEPEKEMHPPPLVTPTLVPGKDVYSDVLYMYTNVLLDYPESELVSYAIQVILDSKQFVKEWPFRDADDQLLRFFCQVTPSLFDLEKELAGKLPPGELVTVPLHATVSELKQAAGKALRDTYCIMEKLVVTDIEGLEEMEDGDVLFGAVESGTDIVVSGSGIDLNSKLRYEGGAENWMVRCECGAQDDDGERMVACDICEVWHHTRCCGIEDSEDVPPLFVCPGCCTYFVQPRSEPVFNYLDSNDPLLNPETGCGMSSIANELCWNSSLICEN
ncbi:hypothetical protein SLA2020_036760 [Shorea laevis]